MSDIILPNIKKNFIPDHDHIIIDCDLAQADAQVVAWEANDEPLKEFFKAANDDPTLDLHDENCRTIFGAVTPRDRKLAKIGVHATNYGAAARTLAVSLGITVREAENFQRRWFNAHPGIAQWHKTVELNLAEKRCVYNRFGNMRYYFDRPSGILPEALAWIPQSTVALVIDRGLVAIHERLPEAIPLMQVHDSIVVQVHKSNYPKILPQLKECLEIVVPYDDPLVIPVGCEASSQSWGDVRKVDWETGAIKVSKK